MLLRRIRRRERNCGMKKKSGGLAHGLAVTLVVFALVMAAALLLLDYISDVSDEEQALTVKNAVRNAIVTCYAVEGAYPADLDYLKDNYGLAYDESRFLVYYEPFASNIVPDVRVVVKGAAPIG